MKERTLEELEKEIERYKKASNSRVSWFFYITMWTLAVCLTLALAFDVVPFSWWALACFWVAFGLYEVCGTLIWMGLAALICFCIVAYWKMKKEDEEKKELE